MDDESIKKIKTETNRYAATSIDRLKRQNNLKKSSIWHKWCTVKLHELYAFFAIILHMCVVKLPKLSDYWSTDPFLQTSFSSKLLSRDRFSAILFMLHLNDNASYIARGQPNHDALHKIRPFFDSFVQKCKNYFAPYSNLTIDEAMCPFRGRISFRVYIKNKPNKYGLKLFVVCDSATGFVLNCEVYTGSSGNVDNSIVALVDRLCSQYFGKGHCIYMDRYYTSPALLKMLWEKNTLGVGTVMKNRKGLPKELQTHKLKNNESIFLRNGPLLALKWRDTRDVYCLSTKHKATCSTVTVRSKGGNVDKTKPDIILDYNMNKTGVDHADQLHSYYPFHRKSMKWWKKLFFHIFTMSVVNAFILYKEKSYKNVTLANFVRSLGNRFAMLGASVAADHPSPSTSVARLSCRHFPEKVPSTANKQNATRYCKVCSDRGKKVSGKRVRRESRWWCKECGVGLCVPKCFQEFHTKVHYA